MSNEKQKEYYEKNKEKIKAYAKEYYAKNKDKSKKYYQDNKEKIEAYRQEYNNTPANKVKKRRATRKIHSRNKQFVWDIKTNSKCIRCGEDHPACLVFHHRDPSQKKDYIPRLIKSSSIKTIQEEIAKCDILCFNCHQKLHFNQREIKTTTDQNKNIKQKRKKYKKQTKQNISIPSTDPEYKKIYAALNKECIKKRKKEHSKTPKGIAVRKAGKARMEQKLKNHVFEYKSTHPCIKCNLSDAACLVFHHRNPTEKTNHISCMHKHVGLKRIDEEIAKCDILCANCHARLHYEERTAA